MSVTRKVRIDLVSERELLEIPGWTRPGRP